MKLVASKVFYNKLFLSDLLIDQAMAARITVTGVRDDKPIITLETVCINQHNEPVLKGEATVLV